MQISPQQKPLFNILDFIVCSAAFVVPLYFFPDKSRMEVQIAIGLLCATVIKLFSSYNRLASFKGTLPLVAELYGPFVGVLASFINISFLSFIYQDKYLFSRYINLSALMAILAYFFLSRLLIFRQLTITNLSLGPAGETSEKVEFQKYFFSNEQKQKFQVLELPVKGESDCDYHLIGLNQDPWSVFESKIAFYQNAPYLVLVNGQTLQDSRVGLSLLKRCFDLLLGFSLLLILLAPGVLIALLSLILHQENPIFCQERIGMKGRKFKILKFKSFFGNPPKISFWGRFLRRTNLDEIPQVINILKGEMSFVGPRAEMASKANSEFIHSRRNMIRPGLTGFWQLGPYRHKSIDAHLEYDIYYLVVRSFIVDLIVIGLTPLIALSNNKDK